MSPIIEKWQKEVDRLKGMITNSKAYNSDIEQRAQLIVRCNAFQECIEDLRRQEAQAKNAAK